MDWIGGRERNEIWHKGRLGDEDNARTSNTRIAQRNKARDITLDDENASQHDVRFSVGAL